MLYQGKKTLNLRVCLSTGRLNLNVPFELVVMQHFQYKIVSKGFVMMLVEGYGSF